MKTCFDHAQEDLSRFEDGQIQLELSWVYNWSQECPEYEKQIFALAKAFESGARRGAKSVEQNDKKNPESRFSPAIDWIATTLCIAGLVICIGFDWFPTSLRWVVGIACLVVLLLPIFKIYYHYRIPNLMISVGAGLMAQNRVVFGIGGKLPQNNYIEELSGFLGSNPNTLENIFLLIAGFISFFYGCISHMRIQFGGLKKTET